MNYSILPFQVWQTRKKNLAINVERLLAEYCSQRGHNAKNPVIDFLFDYYSFRISQLKKWSPGLGVILAGKQAQTFLQQNHYRKYPQGVGLDSEQLPSQRFSSIGWILELLTVTASRQPFFGCFGLHEWAMVYNTNSIRHSQIPLRISKQEINSFVDSQKIRCTHYDAYRFFSKAARPLNFLKPTKKTVPILEQAGCLHANMDLYKWAYKLYPWIDSDLIYEAFELAFAIRKLDMQASPYDLQEFGYSPIAIETPAGRHRYLEKQQQFYTQAQSIRKRLIVVYKNIYTILTAKQQPRYIR